MTRNSLTVDFGFIEDDKLRAVIEDYHRQALASFQAGLHAATVVLCGGVLEGAVTWGIQHRLRREGKSEREVEAIAALRLEQLIDRAARLALLGVPATHASWAVKDFRNHVHPYKVLKGSSRPDAALATSALAAVSEIVRSLRGRLKNPGIEELSSTSRPARSDDEVATRRALNFCWLIPDSLAGCRGPRSESELRLLRSLGVNALVRLASVKEAAVSHSQVEAMGMSDCHEPVADYSAPEIDQVRRAVAFVKHAIDAGQTVAVSCGAGYGRTSTLLACVLISRGKSADEALSDIKTICSRAPEREAQVELVRAFERIVTTESAS